MKKKKRPISFSKILALIVTYLFVGSVIFVFYVWYREDRIGTEILSYVAAPFSIVISGYFVKSGVENYPKIKQNPNYDNDYYENQDVNNFENNNNDSTNF